MSDAEVTGHGTVKSSTKWEDEHDERVALEREMHQLHAAELADVKRHRAAIEAVWAEDRKYKLEREAERDAICDVQNERMVKAHERIATALEALADKGR